MLSTAAALLVVSTGGWSNWTRAPWATSIIKAQNRLLLLLQPASTSAGHIWSGLNLLAAAAACAKGNIYEYLYNYLPTFTATLHRRRTHIPIGGRDGAMRRKADGGRKGRREGRKEGRKEGGRRGAGEEVCSLTHFLQSTKVCELEEVLTTWADQLAPMTFLYRARGNSWAKGLVWHISYSDFPPGN